MSLFEGQPLRTLGRLLTFRAGALTAPTELAVESPIIPTFDLRRYAELRGLADGSAGQFLIQTPRNVHSIGDTQTTNVDPYASLRTALSIDQQTSDNLEMWFGGASLNVDTNTLTEAAVTYDLNGIPGGTFLSQWPLAYWASGLSSATAGSGLGRFGLAGATSAPYITRGLSSWFPCLRPAGAGTTPLHFVSVSSGAATMQANLLFWWGARGTLPPGMF